MNLVLDLCFPLLVRTSSLLDTPCFAGQSRLGLQVLRDLPWQAEKEIRENCLVSSKDVLI